MNFFSLEMSEMAAQVTYNSRGINKYRKMAIYENDAEGFAELNALYRQKCAEEYKRTGQWTCEQ